MYDRKCCAGGTAAMPAPARPAERGAPSRASVRADAQAAELPVMAYVPWQSWEGILDEPKALCEGTIFAAMVKPFRGKGCFGQ